MRRRIAYGALAVMAAWAIYGLAHEHLFSQPVWLEEGIERFLAFTGIYWAAAAAILLVRRAWLVPAIAAFAFVYSTWWCAGHFVIWAPSAVLYFLGSCWMLGRCFARGVAAIVAGLAIWVFVLSMAMHFDINRPWVYAFAFALPYSGRFRPRFTIPEGSWGMAALGFVLMAHLLPALGPEVSSDGLAMHLGIPWMILRDGKFAFDFHQYAWALMPMGGDLAFSAVYLIGGEAAARLLNFSLLVVLAVMVYQAARRWLTPSKAALAAALFASTPVAQLVSGSLFVEIVWAVFIAASAMAIAEGEMALGGMLLGAAFATKVGTSAYLLPAIVAAVFTLKKAKRPRKMALSGALLFILFAVPPYWYAWHRTGNPLFPFENQIFHSPDFDQIDIMRDVMATRPPVRNAFYGSTFHSSEFIEGQDGAFGFQYFLLLPALLILWNRRAPGWLMAIALAGALSSFLSLPNLRYLFPALALISIGFAWLMAEMPWLTGGMAALLALNMYFFPSAGWYHKDFALFTQAQWKDYMTVAAPQRELVEILSRTSPGEPVAFLRGETLPGLTAKSYSETWHTYPFWKRMVESENASDVSQLFHDYGIKHVITPIPPDSQFEVVRDFVNNWTAPSGASRGIFELRNVLPTRMERLKENVAAVAGTYDDRDWRIEYAGAWLHDRQFKKAAAGSITYSKNPGDSLHFYFSGARIDYVYTKAPNRGIAEVWIDRRKRAEIDEYSPEIEWQQRTAFSDLEPGPHTIEIRVTARKSAGSADVYVDLDELVVGG